MGFSYEFCCDVIPKSLEQAGRSVIYASMGTVPWIKTSSSASSCGLWYWGSDFWVAWDDVFSDPKWGAVQNPRILKITGVVEVHVDWFMD